MATAERRALAIEARVFDAASKQFRAISASAVHAGRSIVGGFRGAIGTLTSLRGLATGMVAAFAASRVVGAVRSVADGLDQLAKTSDQLGLTAESLGAIRHQAETAGVSLQEVGSALRTFERNLTAAQKGTGDQARALGLLGLRVEDFQGKQLNTVEVFARVADGLKGVGSAYERTRVLTDLFGDSGAKLATLLKPGGDAIRQMADEAQRLGLVFSREELARAEEFNDALTKVQQTFRGLFERIVVDLAPAFTKALEELRDLFVKHGSTIRDTIFSITDAFAGMAETVAIGTVRMIDWITQLSAALRDIASRIEVIKAAVVVADSVLGFGTDNERMQARARLTLAIDEWRRAQVALGDEVLESGRKMQASMKATEEFFSQLREKIRAAREEQRRGATVAAGTKPPSGNDPPTTEESRRLADNLYSGVQRAALAWRDFNQVAFQAGQDLVNGPLNAMSNAFASIIDGTRTAKDAFRDFGRATIKVLADVAAKMLTVQLVSGIFGLPNGATPNQFGVLRAKGGVDPGGVDRLLPVRGFAKGGIVRRPTFALMGEGSAPAEAFVPLPDGRSIPVSFDGAAPSGPAVVNVNIQAWDGTDVMRVLRKHRGILRELQADDLNRFGSVRQHHQRALR